MTAPNDLTFTVTKPINLLQLTDEVSTAVGQSVAINQTGPEDISQPISATNEATLTVLPDTVDATKVQAAITAHVPTPNYGISDLELKFQAVYTKISDNPESTLTADEVQTLAVWMTLVLSRSAR